MGLRDTLREAAAEIFGYRDEREELLEEGADAKLIQRALENVGWSDIAGGTMQNYFEPTREAREQYIERAYRFFFDDPIIKRSVKIRTNYIFRQGVPMPRYREDRETGDDDDQGRAEDLIKRFWNDPENQAALTSKKALRECHEEKTVQGNLFFLMFRQEGEPPETEIGASGKGRDELEPPTMKVTHLRVREVVEIITHPANQKIPVYYKRVFTEKTARFEKSGSIAPYQEAYDVSKRRRVLYYRDWRFEAPTEHNGKPWGPPKELIAEGRVYHVKMNAIVAPGVSPSRSGASVGGARRRERTPAFDGDFVHEPGVLHGLRLHCRAMRAQANLGVGLVLWTKSTRPASPSARDCFPPKRASRSPEGPSSVAPGAGARPRR